MMELRDLNIIGSNNWVVDGNKSSTGKPILCNDMHLQWMMPGIWYEAHLVVRNLNMNIYGFTLAGIPLVIAGHNDHLAWGFTNTGYDVIDWYYLQHFNPKYDPESGSWVNIDDDESVKGIFGKFVGTIKRGI